jgi:hypothetical protein
MIFKEALRVEVVDGGNYISHNGSQAGASANLFIILQERFAVTVPANMDGVNPQVGDLTQEIVEHMHLPYPKTATP